MTTSKKMDTKNSTGYKNYSLSRLEDSIFDAMQSGATAREVFDTIFNIVKDERNLSEQKMGYAADLLAYLRSGGRLNFEKDLDDLTSDEIKAQGGYEWTPATPKDETIDRNDPVRLAYERGWVYESPDNGKTVTKRRVGETQKYPVK
jgi:hypothetical protein